MTLATSSLHHGHTRLNLTMMDVLGHLIIWLLISLVTFGIGLFFWPYASAKLIINAIELEDRTRSSVGRLECQLSVGQQIGHIILWIILSIITFGIAYPFYFFGVVRTAIDRTRIV
ncbi:MAG: hypothetical protein OXF50_19210 [Caldilineaceae bacterium]|nr:hypothetical protein [Caldilineaceae bacterium]